MNKLVVRNKIIRFSDLNYRELLKKRNLKKKDLIKDYGMNRIIKEVYEEDKNYEDLYKEYISLSDIDKLDDCEESNFLLCYQINKEYVVNIDSHITLYKLDREIKIGKKNIVPWRYAEGEMYIGDTWWFDDEEILKDLLNLNMIEFYKKYKGF